MTGITLEPKTDILISSYSLFNESVLLTLGNYSEDDITTLKQFIISLARQYTPYALIRLDSLDEVTSMVFTSELIRDFIWKLQFNYYSVLGTDVEIHSSIIHALTNSLTINDDDNPNEYNLIPKALKERFLNFETIKQVLVANKWLVLILLIQLTYSMSFRVHGGLLSIKDYCEK